MCRWAQLLAYEGRDGNLILAQAGADKHASGFAEGMNVQHGDTTFSMDGRFSDYNCYRLAFDSLGDLGSGGNLMGHASDPNVKRHRMKAFVAEAGALGQDICQKRAQWEATRNAGRGAQATVTADSWKDSGGTLWTPNWLAPVSLAQGKITGASWLIGQVSFLRDGEQGTRAEVMLIDKSAFLPEPVLLQPELPDLQPGQPGAPAQ